MNWIRNAYYWLRYKSWLCRILPRRKLMFTSEFVLGVLPEYKRIEMLIIHKREKKP